MIQTLFALFLILHGIVHLLGFIVPWRLALPDAHTTTVLGGRVELGEGGIRLYGLLWLAAAALYALAGLGLLFGASWWLPLTIGVTLFSVLLCLSGLPDTAFGLIINLFLLGLLFYGERIGFLVAAG